MSARPFTSLWNLARADAGTPWGEPRRDALAEVIKVAVREWAGLDETKEEIRHEFALMIADAVLQHLASQRQEQDYDGLLKAFGEFRRDVRHATGEPSNPGSSDAEVISWIRKLRAQAAAQGEEIKKLKALNDDADRNFWDLDKILKSKDALVARLGELVKMTARCLREAGRGDIADVVLAEPIMRSRPRTPTP